MAWEQAVQVMPAQLAGEDFSPTGSLTGVNGGQFLIVKQNAARTADTVVHCNSVKDRPRGIIQNNPVSGDGASVMNLGISKVIAGGTLSPGDEYGTDSAGRAVKKNPTSTGANYGDYVLGEVIEGAAVGELATVTVYGPYRI